MRKVENINKCCEKPSATKEDVSVHDETHNEYLYQNPLHFLMEYFAVHNKN